MLSNNSMLSLLMFAICTITMAFDQTPQRDAHLSAMNALTGAPETTAKPVLRHDLVRRDSGQVLMAPDYTCGYIDGRAGKYLRSTSLSLRCLLFSFRRPGHLRELWKLYSFQWSNWMLSWWPPSGVRVSEYLYRLCRFLHLLGLSPGLHDGP